jgi:hypothetical protein
VHSETTEKPRRTESANLARSALVFVVLIGIVSLFSDMTYEAARGINGAFLAYLGASAVVVGVSSGLAELLGYIVRLGSGYVAGRTGRYWLWTGIGFVVKPFRRTGNGIGRQLAGGGSAHHCRGVSGKEFVTLPVTQCSRMPAA